jgi:hypothetical protein
LCFKVLYNPHVRIGFGAKSVMPVSYTAVISF